VNCLRRYADLVNELFALRATGEASDDEEARIAAEMHDCRSGMTVAEENRISALIEKARQKLPD